MGSSVLTVAETSKLPEGTKVHVRYNSYLKKTWGVVYRDEAGPSLVSIFDPPTDVDRIVGDKSSSEPMTPAEALKLGLTTVQVL